MQEKSFETFATQPKGGALFNLFDGKKGKKHFSCVLCKNVLN